MVSAEENVICKEDKEHDDKVKEIGGIEYIVLSEN